MDNVNSIKKDILISIVIISIVTAFFIVAYFSSIGKAIAVVAGIIAIGGSGFAAYKKIENIRIKFF